MENHHQCHLTQQIADFSFSLVPATLLPGCYCDLLLFFHSALLPSIDKAMLPYLLWYFGDHKNILSTYTCHLLHHSLVLHFPSSKTSYFPWRFLKHPLRTLHLLFSSVSLFPVSFIIGSPVFLLDILWLVLSFDSIFDPIWYLDDIIEGAACSM